MRDFFLYYYFVCMWVSMLWGHSEERKTNGYAFMRVYARLYACSFCASSLCWPPDTAAPKHKTTAAGPKMCAVILCGGRVIMMVREVNEVRMEAA